MFKVSKLQLEGLEEDGPAKFWEVTLENHSNSVLILRFCEERLVRYINLPTDLPKRGSDLELDVTAYIDRQIVTPVLGDVLLGKKFEEGEAELYK